MDLKSDSAASPLEMLGYSPSAFRKDGRQLVVGGPNNTARIWDVNSAKPIYAPMSLPGRLIAAQFTPDGKTVILGTDDGSCLRWTLPSAMPGESQDLILWAQVVTGEEIGEDNLIRPISTSAWRDDVQRLNEIEAKRRVSLP